MTLFQNHKDAERSIRSFRALTDLILDIPRGVVIQARDLATNAMAKARLSHSTGNHAADDDANRDDASAALVALKSKTQMLGSSLDLDMIAEDIGNDPNLVPTQQQSNTGVVERMSGQGASAMVRQFSELSEQSTFLTEAYAAMGARLDGMEEAAKADRKSAAKLAKAVVAVATLLSTAIKGRDAAQQFMGETEPGEESDDDDDDEDENTTKSGVKVQNLGNVPALMKYLSGASRGGAAPGNLQQPPDLSGTHPAMRKSKVSLKSAITQAIDGGRITDELDQLAAQGILACYNSAQSGNDFARDIYARKFATASHTVQQIVAEAGYGL